MYEQGRGGLPKNDQEAVRLYKLAADQGYAKAQRNLAISYLKGVGGLSKNEQEAARLLKLAAEKGLTMPNTLSGWVTKPATADWQETNVKPRGSTSLPPTRDTTPRNTTLRSCTSKAAADC